MAGTLYVTDLDGTLLDRQNKVPAYSLEVLNRLIERGLAFTCATARSWSSAKKVTEGLRLHLPVVVYNGAFLLDPKTGERLRGHWFSQGQAELVRKLAEEKQVSPLVYAFVEGKERVSWRPDRENQGISYYIGNRQGDGRFRPVKTEEALYQGEIFYFTCIGAREELAPLWEALKNREEYTVTFQQELYRREYWLEIMPRKATKAHGVRELKSLLGFDRLVVFGDAVNDVPLFEAADEKYAVANAVPELKALANGILESNEENGVARYLRDAAGL